jgi:putative transposase
VKRLRQLEAENARLKKLVAERDLEIEVMREAAREKW